MGPGSPGTAEVIQMIAHIPAMLEMDMLRFGGRGAGLGLMLLVLGIVFAVGWAISRSGVSARN